MATGYRLTAKRNLGKIPKGYIIQVISNNPNCVQADDIKKVLTAAGFDDSATKREAFNTAGWTSEKLK